MTYRLRLQWYFKLLMRDSREKELLLLTNSLVKMRLFLLKQSLPIYPLIDFNFFLLMNQINIVRTSSIIGVKPTYFHSLFAPEK
ncbi:hypothetical protein SAMN04487786_0083 [Paenisporosarcina quisquiliarum]|nr:hypothetical protein SAMN04487786_0083 [Paenisporosarcina quisquiliarum]SFM92951.1 hypothetical protein SAMN05421832_10982 [Psychrobacillus psychrodurans]